MSSLKAEPWTADLQSRCQLYKLRQDLAGGILKKGMEVWALHHLRVYVPLVTLLKTHKETKSVTVELDGNHRHPGLIAIQEAVDLAVCFEIDGQLFSNQFEVVLPKGVIDTSEPLIVPIQ